MGFNPTVAIRFTPYYGAETAWTDVFPLVFGALGFADRSPTATEFVTAVRKWQQAHPPLHGDGMLGPLTWKSLLPSVQTYNGPINAGTLPAWAVPPRFRGKSQSAGTAPQPAAPPSPVPSPVPSPPPSAPSTSATTPEDQLIQEFIRIGRQLKINPLVPVPVSTAYAIDQARMTLPEMFTGGVCGTIKVGQVWGGLGGGNRILIALIPGAVIFITDSGQAYYHSLEGWNSDFMASVYRQVGKDLAPLATILEIEAEVLLGALAASSGVGFVGVNGLGVLQWLMQNRDNIGKWSKAFSTIASAWWALRKVSPTMAFKVLGQFIWKDVQDMPETALNDNKMVARYVGIMLVKVGKLILKRDASVLLEVLPSLLKRVLIAMGQLAKAAALPTIFSLVESGPGAGPRAARDEAVTLVQELAHWGVHISLADAKAIYKEVRDHPDDVANLLVKLQDAAKTLL
jgi:hypothetical protein